MDSIWFDNETAQSVQNATGGIRHEPVSFGGCFGWLHWPADVTNDVAVLICNGIGRDAAQAHRSLRYLADRVAESGVPVLRFDYPGTGDSLDPPTTERWDHWISSAREAAELLRARTGARRLAMIGFRLGALVAGLAASDTEVSALLLIEPILRGRSFITQMQTEARLRPPGHAEAGLSLNEIQFDQDDTIRIAQADLRSGPVPRADHIAVFQGGPSVVIDRCINAWNEAGIATSQRALGALDVLTQPGHLSDALIGTDDLLAVLDEIHGPRRAPGNTAWASGPVLLTPPGCVERPVCFGPGGRLAGILCEPRKATDHVLVIGNTGGDPHHGFARFSVQLARALALSGIATLRFDFAGLGDSTGPLVAGVEQPVHVFTTSRDDDIRAALDMLEARGYRRFSLKGLCSGAFHALQAAVSDGRVRDLCLINLPTFSLRVDRPLPYSHARRAMAALAQRRTRVLLLYASGDPGLSLLHAHFGADGAGLHDNVTTAILDGIDHDLTTDPMRAAVAGRLASFLDSDHQPAFIPTD